MKHHINGPSGIIRRIHCPGSAAAEAAIPEPESSPEAAEGTRLHAVLAGTDTGEWMDSEQQELVTWCQDAVTNYALTQVNPTIYRELSLTLLAWNYRILSYGTADVVIVSEASRTAVLIDYKFGRGEVPEPADNPQLSMYAAMVFQRFQVDRIEAVILQPRITRSPKAHVYTNRSGLVDYFRNVIAECEKPDAPRNAGEHCKYCRAAESCQERARNAMESLTVAETGVVPAESMEAMETAQLGEIYRENLSRVTVFQKYWDKLEVTLKCRMMAGETIPGLELKRSAGNRQCVDPLELYNALKPHLSHAEFMASVTVSPAKLEESFVMAKAEKDATGKLKRGQKIKQQTEFLQLTMDWIKRGQDRISLVLCVDQKNQ